MTGFGATGSIPTGGIPLGGDGPVDAIITQALPFLSQAMSAGVPALIELPDPTELCDGKRAKFGFYVVAAGGMIIQATAGARIRIGGSLSSVNGEAFGSAVGDYLELTAISDSLWGATSEVPDGAWTTS